MSDSSFLIVFEDEKFSRREIINILEDADFVYNWYAFHPTCIAFVSDETAKKISQYFRDKTNKKLRFIVVKTEEKGGLLRTDVADFIKNPKRVEK